MADIRQLSPELAERARTELNEVDERITEDIAALREWIKTQAHLKTRTSDQFLLAFLRGCKYNFEKAKEKIDYFHTIKSISPDEFLNNQITEKSMKLTRIGPFLPLPRPMKPDGPCILFTRYEGIDLDEFSFVDLFKLQMRINNILMHENDNCVIRGVVNVCDMANVKLSFFLKFDPVLGKKMEVFTEKALPFRIGGIHIINFPPEALTILKMIQGLMSKKSKERMMVHASIESLCEHVPREYLPEEYGGNNGRISDCIETLQNLMLKYRTYFEEDNEYRSNEELRVGTKVTLESLFGLEGSFRKLEID